MPRKPPRETPIERMFREASGYKMPALIRRILLRKPRPKFKRGFTKRHMLEFPDHKNCESYLCSDCDWRHDIRLFDINPGEFWTALGMFEMHDCFKHKPNKTPDSSQG